MKILLFFLIEKMEKWNCHNIRNFFSLFNENIFHYFSKNWHNNKKRKKYRIFEIKPNFRNVK